MYNQFFDYTFKLEDYKVNKNVLNPYFYLMGIFFTLNIQAFRITNQQVEQALTVPVQPVQDRPVEALPLVRPTLDFVSGIGMHVFCDAVSHARAMFAAEVDRISNSEAFPSHQQILRMSINLFPYGNQGRWAALLDGDNYLATFSERPAAHALVQYHIYARPGTRVFESYPPAVQAQLGYEYSQAYHEVTSQRIR